MGSAVKHPPHSVEAEMSVLGAMMLDHRCVDDLLDLLTAADFWNETHQLIFSGIAAMQAARQPADFVTLSEHLRQSGLLERAGGLAYLGNLVNDTPSVVNVRQYGQIVRERAILRRLIAAGLDIAEMGYAQDGRNVDERVNDAQARVSHLADAHATDVAPLMPEAMVEWTAELERRMRGETGAVPTGLHELDEQLGGGLQKTDMVVIAGRPSEGKTALALGMMAHAAQQGHAGLVITMEMSRHQLLTRIVSRMARVDAQGIQSGKVREADMPAIVDATSRLSAMPLIVEYGSGLTAQQMQAMVRRAVRRMPNLRLVMVDYLQLGTSTRENDNRNQQVGEISAAMKAIAMEHGVSVLALSQLSRKVDERASKRPMLSDLRDSGAIEQDADVILFPYRPQFHDAKRDGVSPPDVERAEIIVGKQRTGPTGSAAVAFHGRFASYESLHMDAEPEAAHRPERRHRNLGDD